MASQFPNSLFYSILMDKSNTQMAPSAILGGIVGSYFSPKELFHDLPVVVFDFETTGLDTRHARIIEVGAIKYHKRKEVARFSSLVSVPVKLSADITRITGITDDMLVGQPPIEAVLPRFHEFLQGCVGVAHNAEFDLGMLWHESQRLGIGCDYTLLCTLKMARAFIKLESRNLDSLAKHFGLSFESRHRSLGDILVTAQVLWQILDMRPELKTMGDLTPFREQK